MNNVSPDISINHRPCGGLWRTITQADLVNGVSTKVLFTAKCTGFLDSIEDIVLAKITPGVAGLYSVIGRVMLVSVIANKSYSIELMLSGVLTAQMNFHSGLATTLSLSINEKIWFSKTDYIETWVTSNAGVNTVDIYFGQPYTKMQVVRER